MSGVPTVSLAVLLPRLHGHSTAPVDYDNILRGREKKEDIVLCFSVTFFLPFGLRPFFYSAENKQHILCCLHPHTNRCETCRFLNSSF
jgi:hypothetical protein